MADPANNVLAAASTSRRKRVLPTQPPSEAKRLRTSQEDISENKQTLSTKNSNKVSKVSQFMSLVTTAMRTL